MTIFCEACVDEVFKGDRPNTHFSKKAWTNIIAAFEKKTGKEYPRAKYKHKWDGLKIDWELPEATKFRKKGLENVDLLDIMFKDVTATGDLAWAPTSSVLPDDIK
ncbi:L10-interacting MYB domain-containing protein-like [Quercus suber]|uniref:L10-interacting MYB domain-containing protein-like n=1 Tax=Quercus suber TaxID=58331 RepID=UPI0032DEA6D2